MYAPNELVNDQWAKDAMDPSHPRGHGRYSQADQMGLVSHRSDPLLDQFPRRVAAATIPLSPFPETEGNGEGNGDTALC